MCRSSLWQSLHTCISHVWFQLPIRATLSHRYTCHATLLSHTYIIRHSLTAAQILEFDFRFRETRRRCRGRWAAGLAATGGDWDWFLVYGRGRGFNPQCQLAVLLAAAMLDGRLYKRRMRLYLVNSHFFQLFQRQLTGFIIHNKSKKDCQKSIIRS